MTHLAILAAEPAASTQERIGGFVEFLLANPFGIILTLVFLTAIVGAFAAARKRDRCLTKFHNFPVTIVPRAGGAVWGRLRVYSKALELLYDGASGPLAKRSFLFYEAELPGLLAVYRFKDRLRGDETATLLKQVRRVTNPLVGSRIWRWMRNVVNTFRDAIVQSLGMTVQQAAKVAPMPILTTGGSQVASIGTMILGTTANAYEPMLERHIGHSVVLNLINPADPEKRILEFHGCLGEYSTQYVLLVKARRTFSERVSPGGTGARIMEGTVKVTRADGQLHVENQSAVPVEITALEWGQASHKVGQAVPAGGEADLPLPPDFPADGAAVISYTRQFDLLTPRTCGIVRHASEQPA